MLGQPWQIALSVGLVLALSSTAIVLQTLNEKGLMKRRWRAGELLSPADARHCCHPYAGADAAPRHARANGSRKSRRSEGRRSRPGHELGVRSERLATTLVTLGAVGFVVLCGNYFTRPLFRFIASAGLRELFTSAALMLVIGIALLMTLVGLSPALGTFLAGVVLANSEYRHELEADIEPFKGLLLGLFFMTVGASINFGLLSANLVNILLLTFGLIAVKVLVLLVLGYIFKIRGGHKWLFALSLAQAGEFGFVLLSFTVMKGFYRPISRTASCSSWRFPCC